MPKYYVIVTIPLVIAAIILGFFITRLDMISDGQDITQIPSALIGKPAPILNVPYLYDDTKFSDANIFQGKVTFLNFFASWCVPCRAEHPQLLALAKHNELQMVGLAWKDKKANAKAFLEELTNPFDITLSNEDGSAAIDFGTFGLPESYIIDKKGIIRYKKTGPLTPPEMNDVIALIDSLK